MQIHLNFRSRRPGSFGPSPLGRLAESVTLTWLRFTCTLFTLLIGAAAVLSSAPLTDKAMLIVAAPIGALAFWCALLLCLLVCRYLGVAGRILAHVLVIYFCVFSRLIVQSPPTLLLRLTR